MTDAITVYEHPLSPYAQKVKLGLREKSLPFSVTTPGFGAEDAVAEFAKLSPQREVPVLVHDDEVLVESAIILAYLEETWPTPALLPASASERARVRLLERNMDTHFEANTWGLGETLIFCRAQGKLAAQLTDHASSQIRLWFSWLESQLEPRTWFNGDAFGYGDLCVIPHVNGAARFDLTPPPNSRLARWTVAANALDNVALTQAEAVAAELDPATMQAAVAAGFQREYRDHRLEWMIRAGGLSVVEAGLSANNVRFNGAPT